MHCKCHHSWFLKWSAKHHFFLRILLVKDPALIFYLKQKKEMKISYFTGEGKKTAIPKCWAAKVVFSVWFSRHLQQRTAIFHSIHHMLSLLISNKMKTSKAMLQMFSIWMFKRIAVYPVFDCSASVKPFTGMQTRRKVLKCLWQTSAFVTKLTSKFWIKKMYWHQKKASLKTDF